MDWSFNEEFIAAEVEEATVGADVLFARKEKKMNFKNNFFEKNLCFYIPTFPILAETTRRWILLYLNAKSASSKNSDSRIIPGCSLCGLTSSNEIRSAKKNKY